MKNNNSIEIRYPQRINDSIKNQSYTADKFCMLSKFGPES